MFCCMNVPLNVLLIIHRQLNELNDIECDCRCCPATCFDFPDRAASEPEALTVASPAPVSSAKQLQLVGPMGKDFSIW